MTKKEQCFMCERMFNTKCNFNKYMQNVHGVDNRNSVHLVKYPMYENHFKTLSELFKHILKDHNVHLKKEFKAFDYIHDT